MENIEKNDNLDSKKNTPKYYKKRILENLKGISEKEINKIKACKIDNIEVRKVAEKVSKVYKKENFYEIINGINKFYNKIEKDNRDFANFIKTNKKFEETITRPILYYIKDRKSSDLSDLFGIVDIAYENYSIFFKKQDKKLWTFPNIYEILLFQEDHIYIKKIAELVNQENNIDSRLNLALKIDDIISKFWPELTINTNFLSDTNAKSSLSSDTLNKLKKLDTSLFFWLDQKTIDKFFKNTDNIEKIIDKLYQLQFNPTQNEKNEIKISFIEKLKEFHPNYKEQINNFLNNNENEKEKLLNIIDTIDIQLIDTIIYYKKTKKESEILEILSIIISKHKTEDAKFILNKLIKSKIINGEKDLGINSNKTEDIFKFVVEKTNNIVQTFLNIKNIDKNTIEEFVKENYSNLNNKDLIVNNISKAFSENNIRKLKSGLMSDVINNKNPLTRIKNYFKKYKINKIHYNGDNNNDINNIIFFAIKLTNFMSNKNKKQEKKEYTKLVNIFFEQAKEKYKNTLTGNILLAANIKASIIYEFAKTKKITQINNLNDFIKNNKDSLNTYVKRLLEKKFQINTKNKNTSQYINKNENKNTSTNTENKLDIPNYFFFGENDIPNKETGSIKIPTKNKYANSKDYEEFLRLGTTNISYKQYLKLKKQINKEKGLLTAIGATTTEIKKNKSLLFNNQNENSFQIKSIEIDGTYIIESYIPEKNLVLQIKSLNLKDGNKELVSSSFKKLFNLNISFEKWTGDEFNKIIKSDITKNTLTSADIFQIKSFFQIYFYKLWEKNKLPKGFFKKFGLKIQDIIKQPERFTKAFSERVKNKLQLDGLKTLGTTFYLDPSNTIVKETITDISIPGKIKEIENEILTQQNDKLFASLKNILRK